jgi:hypothetical protein
MLDPGAASDGGSTLGGLQLFFLLENPNDRQADVQVTCLRPFPHSPIVRGYVLPLSRRCG